MNLKQFNRAVAIAKSDEDLSAYEPLAVENGLPDIKPFSIQLKSVAALVRVYAVSPFGDISTDALNAIQHYGRRKFQII